MAGMIKSMIDTILEKRSAGNPTIYATTKTKLMIKGIPIAKYTAESEDDPAVVEKLKVIAREMGIAL